jgi:Lrp/AsnC family leucine-responsive transcriptional regulator
MDKIVRKRRTPTEVLPRALDSIGWKILIELQTDARIPFAELGRRVGLSTPAVIERVHRLEETEIITGYRAQVDPAKVGYSILAYIRVNVVGDFLPRIVKISREMPEVLECHRITGADSFIMKVAVKSVNELQALIDGLTPFVGTTTAIVLSEIVRNRVLEPRPQSSEV